MANDFELPRNTPPELRRRIEDESRNRTIRKPGPKGGPFSSIQAPSASMTQRQRLRGLQSDILSGTAGQPESPVIGGLPSAEEALTRPRPGELPFTPGLPQTVTGTPGSGAEAVPGLGFIGTDGQLYRDENDFIQSFSKRRLNRGINPIAAAALGT